VPIIAEKLRDEKPGRTSRGYYATEVWEVLYVEDDNTTINLNGVVDPRQAPEHPMVPAHGQPHPTFPSAIVVDKRVIKVHANWSVFVAVSYRGWGLYSGGPHSAAVSYTDQRIIEVPIWRIIPTAGGLSGYEENLIPRTREVALRVYTRFRAGNEQEQIGDAISDNVGKAYTLNGRLYVLSGRSSASYDGQAYTRAVYVFERPGELAAIPASDPNWGNTIAVPPLPAHYLYSSLRHSTPTNPTSPPVVNAVQPNIVFGGPLPGIP
jgi:hypothetical protein